MLLCLVPTPICLGLKGFVVAVYVIVLINYSNAK
jgi:hypothetical protein